MDLKYIKPQLSLISRKIHEFRKQIKISSPKPNYERLFSDFNEIVGKLAIDDPEVFGGIDSTIKPTTKRYTVKSSYLNGSTHSQIIYDKNSLELLLFEVERVEDFIKESEKNSSNTTLDSSHVAILNNLTTKFAHVSNQLKKRHSKRATLQVNDEYDVQDLFHSLLRLFFEDIRTETYIPEYAGGNSRIDFVLKAEQTGIEIKKSRTNLRGKEVGEQLIIDIARYQEYSNIQLLYCFVFDPEHLINNPVGIENDLSGDYAGLQVIVMIEPK